MAVGYNAGTSYLKVLPSLQGFASKLRADLSKIKETVDVKVQADASSLRAEIQAAAQAAANGVRADISVGVDATGLRQEMRAAAEAAAAGTNTKIKVELDADVNGLRAQLASIGDVKVRVELEPDIAAFRARMAAMGPIRVDVDLEPDLAALRARLAAERLRTSVDVDVDSSGRGASSASNLTRMLGLAGAAVLALGASGPALAPLVSALVAATGAAGLLPAALAGAGAGFAAIKIGVSGVGDAFTALSSAETASAATSSAASTEREAAAKRVASAVQALGDAQRNADRVSAQSAQQVTDARSALAEAQIAAARKVADATQDYDRAVAQSAQRVSDARARVSAAMSASARATAAAEQTLQRAQVSAQRAQEDLTRARKDATEQLEDLKLSLSGASLDQEAATLGLARAKEQLANMPTGSTALDFQEAELAVRQAEQALAETTERYGDVKEESAAAGKAGVEGSDLVKNAQERLSDANQGVADAESALTQTRLDGAADVTAAQADLAQAQIDGARDVADAQANLSRAQADGAKQVADAQQGLSRAQQAAGVAQEDAARQVQRAQVALGEAYADTGSTGAASADKVAAALAKLAPAARAYVAAVQALRPAWDALKMDVQNALFRDLGASLTTMANAQLPGLRAGLTSIAAGFNEGARGVMAFLSSTSAIADVRQILADSAISTRAWAAALVPITAIFLDFAAVGAPILAEISQGFLSAAERAAAFIENARQTGQLEEWIRGGLDALKAIGELLGNLGGSIKAIFDAMSAAGGGLMSTLILVTGELEAFLKSDVGQSGLTAFFRTLHDTVGALMPGLQAIGGALMGAIVALGPALPGLADALSAVAIAVAPLIVDLAELAAVILPPLSAVLVTIAPLLGPIAAGLLAIWAASKVSAALTAVRVAMIGFAIAQGAITAAAGVGMGMLAALRAAILGIGFAIAANPIGILVTALIGLGAALVFAYKHSETFRNIVNGAFEAVKTAVMAVVDFFTGPFVDGVVSAFNAVIGFFRDLPANIVNIIVGMGSAISSAAVTAWNGLVTGAQVAGAAVLDFVANLPQRIFFGLGFLTGLLVQAAVEGWNGFTTGIATAFNATLAFIQSIPDRVVSGLATLGSFLSSTATSSWESFTTGLLQAFVNTIVFVQSIPSRVVGALAAIGSSLLTTGSDAMASFTTGIVNGFVATGIFLASLPGKIIGFFVNAPSWLLEVGGNIISGLLTGLGNAAAAVGNFFMSLIESFVAGFKAALGIASPSTVFAQFGAWILEGLLNGLRALLTSVIDFVVGIGTALLGAFQIGVDAIVGLWNSFWTILIDTARAIFTGISDAIGVIFGIIESIFGLQTGSISASWQTFWNVLSSVATAIFDVIRAGIDFVWALIKAIFTGNFEQVDYAWNVFWFKLQNLANLVFTAIKDFVALIWQGIQTIFMTVTTALTALWDMWWANLRLIGETVFNAIRVVVETVWGVIQGVFTTVTGVVSGIWRVFWDTLSSVATTVFGAIRTTIETILGAVRGAFDTAVEAIRVAWDKIKEITAAPIRFMVNTVYKGGIVPAWNFVAGLVGLPKLDPNQPQLGFAQGGPVPDNAPGARRGRDSVSAMLMPGEHVWTDTEVRAAGGHRAVAALRQQARNPTQVLRTLNAGRTVEGADHNGPGSRTTGFGGVRPHVAQAGHQMQAKFGIGVVGGVGSRPNQSDHPSGHALDFMTRGENGTSLANYAVQNAAHLMVKYVIWRQRINSGAGWKGMENRGGDTANHMDHVHVSFLTAGGAGRDFSGAGGVPAFDVDGTMRDQFGPVDKSLSNGKGQFGGTAWGGAALDLVGKGLSAVKDKALKALQEYALRFTAPIVGGIGSVYGALFGNVKDQVKAVAGRFGWGEGGQWSSIDQLVQKESSWNVNAANPTSSARGLFQKMTSIHGPVEGTASGQAEWGLGYIKGRYGDPIRAWDFHRRNNYYDEGGVARGRGIMLKNVLQPERVLSPQQNVAFEQLVAGLSSGGYRQQAQSPIMSAEQWAGRGSNTDAGSLINSLSVTAGEGVSGREIIEEALFAARRARHSGAYRRP